MKLTAIELYAYDRTCVHGTYVMSKGRSAKQQSSSLVRVLTDDGIEGRAEATTLSGNYPAGLRRQHWISLRQLDPTWLRSPVSGS